MCVGGVTIALYYLFIPPPSHQVIVLLFPLFTAGGWVGIGGCLYLLSFVLCFAVEFMLSPNVILMILAVNLILSPVLY